jgi:hypothetical protein
MEKITKENNSYKPKIKPLLVWTLLNSDVFN